MSIAKEQKLRRTGALPSGYTPSSEVGWRLIRLRAKSIASGAKRLNDSELERKISALRG